MKVYLLIDAPGSVKVDRHFLAPLHMAGGRTAFFMPMLRLPLQGRVNLRNHPKMVIAGGQAAIVGGMNLAGEYMGPDLRPDRWQDISVRLIVPQRSNHRLADLARESYLSQLQESGCQVMLYGPRMLHTKAVLIDDAVAVVGSANMDIRSLEELKAKVDWLRAASDGEPTVTATQDPALRSLLDVAAVAQGRANFLRLSTDDLTVLLVRYLVGVLDVSTPYGRWWINEAG